MPKQFPPHEKVARKVVAKLAAQTIQDVIGNIGYVMAVKISETGRVTLTMEPDTIHYLASLARKGWVAATTKSHEEWLRETGQSKEL